MNLSINGKTAVVTGADSGIGFATARYLAREGVNLVMSDKTDEELKAAAEQIKSETKNENKIEFYTADLKINDEVLKLEQFCTNKFGGADILVHCAGIRGAAGDFLKLTDDDWWESIDVDLMSGVRACRAFLPHMLDKKWGRIVLIASENALQPYIEESPYNASKAGVINLTKCLSRAYSPQGVMINCVSPAYIATPMTDAMMDEKAKEDGTSKNQAIQNFLVSDRPNIVVDRRGKPEEVAATITFLCSELASYITGSNYRIDGGSVSTAFG